MSLNEQISRILINKALDYKQQGDNGRYFGYSNAANTILTLPELTREQVLTHQYSGRYIGESMKNHIDELLDEIDPEIDTTKYAVWNKHKHYTSRSTVLDKIQFLLDYLDKSGVKYDIAGSFRRKREYVGDIDILVYSQFPDVSKLSGIQILASGDKKIKLATEDLEVDLRSFPLEERGTALLYFTGSRDFNIYMRRVAKAKGFKLNEYAVIQMDTGKVYKFDNEEDVFKLLGLNYVPPEKRDIQI